MNDLQWNVFLRFRDEFKNLCSQWSQFSSELYPLQKESAKDTPDYNLETAIVYNKAYDEVQKSDKINFIVIGDNPGKEEQLASNQKYLVGQSGRIAEGFFRRNPELGTDFRKNVLILNKTPIHTAKTVQLKYILKNGSKEIVDLVNESQKKMAQLAFELHNGLFYNAEDGFPELWLVGYSELKKNGVFNGYRDELKKQYEGYSSWNKVLVYQHFSMNRFIIDLNEFRKNSNLPLKNCLEEIGKIHKNEIFGS
ncbi:hypothetical protein [uncultured Treponema sp.]|uniref:hypothetical protein n=1 Tax=uncultured Treponema sp. TaxID=162155 RepID=UPI0025EB9FBF|nr:hypothetical protein [uncultured Treponema sp.]MEE0351929.1 hypothetical protein [Treponema sp.]